MPSPACTVNGSATANGVNVAAAAALTIQLTDLTANAWSLSVIGTDELSTAPVVSINQSTRTATLTGLGAGSALGLRSIVNGGITNGKPDPSLTTTMGVYVLASVSNKRVLYTGEATEGNAAAGWVATINPTLRALAASKPTLTVAVANVAGDSTVSNHDGTTYALISAWVGSVAISGGQLRIDVSAEVSYQNLPDDLRMAVFIDGVIFGTPKQVRMPGVTTTSMPFIFSAVGTPSGGAHTATIGVRFLPLQVDSGLANANSWNRCTIIVSD